jgi:uncharacterized lipoprotein YajG
MKRLITLLFTLTLIAGCSAQDTKADYVNSQTTSIQQIYTNDDTIEETKDVTVYVTKTGAKYHSAGCRYLSKSCISISLSDARNGYSPCSVCNPPD